MEIVWGVKSRQIRNALGQGSSNPVLEGHCPEEFSFNFDQGLS